MDTICHFHPGVVFSLVPSQVEKFVHFFEFGLQENILLTLYPSSNALCVSALGHLLYHIVEFVLSNRSQRELASRFLAHSSSILSPLLPHLVRYILSRPFFEKWNVTHALFSALLLFPDYIPTLHSEMVLNLSCKNIQQVSPEDLLELWRTTSPVLSESPKFHNTLRINRKEISAARSSLLVKMSDIYRFYNTIPRLSS